MDNAEPWTWPDDWEIPPADEDNDDYSDSFDMRGLLPDPWEDSNADVLAANEAERQAERPTKRMTDRASMNAVHANDTPLEEFIDFASVKEDAGVVRRGERLGHRVRETEKRQRPPEHEHGPVKHVTAAGIDVSNLRNATAAIRDFIESEARRMGYDASDLLRPFSPGSPRAADGERRDTLAEIIAGARARRATLAALAKVTHRPVSVVFELEKRGRSLLGQPPPNPKKRGMQ